jgi:hypothetical protein
MADDWEEIGQDDPGDADGALCGTPARPAGSLGREFQGEVDQAAFAPPDFSEVKVVRGID